MLVNLQEWFNENIPPDKMIYKEALERQVVFVRDDVPRALRFDDRKDYEEFKESVVVVGTHTSKSIKLPVYQMVWRSVRFILRDNFYDWKVSVYSPVNIHNLNDFKLFIQDKDVSDTCCEGFAKEWVFGAYSKSHRKFTVEIYDRYDLFCFFKILSCNKVFE